MLFRSVKAETEGVVQEILFEEGQRVNKGDVLVRLDETKLAAQLAEAEALFNLSQVNYERSKTLAKDNLIPSSELDQAAASFNLNRATLELKRRQLKETRVAAPFSGVISSRNVSPGQVIGRDATLTWLVDLDVVKVEINVPERFVDQLKPGQKVELGVAAFPNRKFAGEVYFVAPFIDPSTRTALVKARLPNPQRELKPGMFANLDLTLTLRAEATVVPETALTQLLEGGKIGRAHV